MVKEGFNWFTQKDFLPPALVINYGSGFPPACIQWLQVLSVSPRFGFVSTVLVQRNRRITGIEKNLTRVSHSFLNPSRDRQQDSGCAILASARVG